MILLKLILFSELLLSVIAYLDLKYYGITVYVNLLLLKADA